MKKKWFIGLFIVSIFVLNSGPNYAQSRGGQGMTDPGYGMGQGMMGQGMMGQGMMGQGMMGQGMRGQGMRGQGMMGQGGGMGPQSSPTDGPQYQQPPKPLEEKDAKMRVENYLQSKRNPNLKLGKIKDAGTAFEAEIVTKKEGALVDIITVDKNTGLIRSIY